MFNFVSISRKTRAGEKGQALILVLILLTLASLIVPALLGFIATGAKSGTVYDKKTAQLYGADAGIQDAVWQIKYDHLPTTYDPYDFTSLWPDTGITSINGQPVSVTIQNRWMPSNASVPPNAAEIIDAQKLVVTGSTIEQNILDGSNTISKYQIKIQYYHAAGETMKVSSIGIWLPPGFQYYYYAPGSNTNLIDNLSGATRSFNSSQGGQATVWTFSGPDFTTLPAAYLSGTSPYVLTATFYYQPPQSQASTKVQAVSWIVPTWTAPAGISIPVSWDADSRIFKLISMAGPTAASYPGNPSFNDPQNTTVESYIGKSETRQLELAMGGDYYATGNSNLSAATGSYDRTIPHDPSSATVDNTDIPDNAHVTAAFLYWSGYKTSNGTTVFSDACTNFGNWSAGNAWSTPTNNYFQGHYNTGLDITKSSAINLSSYATPTSPGVILSWNQWVTQGATGTSLTGLLNSDDTADTTGNWTPAGTRYTKVNDSNTGTYITQTAASGGFSYFGFQSFSGLTGAVISDVTINYTAKVQNSTITYVGAGTVARAASGNITPALPTGWAANDIFVCVVSSRDNKPATMPSPQWTALESGVSNGTSMQFSVFYRRAVAGDTAPLVTHTGTGNLNITAVIVAYRGCVTSGNPVEIMGPTQSTSGTRLTFVSSTGITTLTNGDMLVGVGCSVPQDTTSNYPSLLPNERIDSPNLSSYNEVIVADGTMATAGNTGRIRADLSSSANYCGKLIALEPIVVTGNVHSGIKVNTTLYNSVDAGVTPASSFTDYSYTYTTNPATGLAWQPSEVTALRYFGVYADQNVSVSDVSIVVDFSIPVTAADGLDFYIWDGSNWQGPLPAFRGNIGGTAGAPLYFAYQIPKTLLTANFKLKFSLVGFAGSGNYANIDNISIVTMAPDTDVVFKIDNNGGGGAKQVYLDSLGNPQTGSVKLTATKCQIAQNLQNQSIPWGYTYESYCDVTKLIQAYSQPPVAPATNYPGYGKYWVGDISVDIANQASYACWSIVIVYESTDTLGHQLYLYDNFSASGQNTSVTSVTVTNGGSGYTSAPTVNLTGAGSGAQAIATVSGGMITGITVTNGGTQYSSPPTVSFSGGGGSGATAKAVIKPVDVDFDKDGQPGGTISGFIVPQQITGAVNKITIDSAGSGYSSAPSVTITGGGGAGASAMAVVPTSGAGAHTVTQIIITNGGTGYTSAPAVNLTGGGGSGAVASVHAGDFGDELNVGKITTFVGEGDIWFAGDYLTLNGTKLWEGTNTTYHDGYSLTDNANSKANPDNAFNSTSYGNNMNDGIDIDTFGIDPAANPAQYITWNSHLLNQGDTSAQIDLYTHTDGWYLGYIIISFRSLTTTGGSLSYLIH